MSDPWWPIAAGSSLMRTLTVVVLHELLGYLPHLLQGAWTMDLQALSLLRGIKFG